MKKNILILTILSLINISSAKAVPPVIDPLQNFKNTVISAVCSGDCASVTEILKNTGFERISDIEAKYFSEAEHFTSLAYFAYKFGTVDMVNHLLSLGASSTRIVWHKTEIPHYNALRRWFKSRYSAPLNPISSDNHFEEAFSRYSMQVITSVVRIPSLQPLLLTAISENRSEFFDPLLQHVDVNEVELIHNAEDLSLDLIDIEKVSRDFREPALHEAIKHVDHIFKTQGVEDFSIIIKLLEAEASITTRNSHNETPLERAVKLNPAVSFSLVRLICEHAKKNNISSYEYGVTEALAWVIVTRLQKPEYKQAFSELASMLVANQDCSSH